MSHSGEFGGALFSLFFLAIIVFLLITVWKIYVKAGKPGWYSLIPFFNYYTLIKIAGRPGWWFILLLVPLINFVIGVIIVFDMAKRFDKGIGFGFGLLFLPFIFYPILAFDDSVYIPAVPE